MSISTVENRSSYFDPFVRVIRTDVMGCLSAFLTKIEGYKLARTSKGTAKLMNQVTNQNESSELKNLIGRVIQKLSKDVHSAQIENLNAIPITGSSFPDILNFTLRSENYFLIEDQIVDVLKDLDEAAINNLSDIPLPSEFGNIFEVAQISRRIVDAEKLPDELTKGAELLSICDDLIQADAIERADTVAQGIRSLIHKTRAIENVCNAYIKMGAIEHAIESAKAISCDADISEALFQAGGYHEAFDKATKTCSLYAIAEALIKSGALQEAFKFTKTLSLEGGTARDSALLSIANGFVKVGQLEGANEVAEAISDKFMRRSAFQVISNARNFVSV